MILARKENDIIASVTMDAPENGCRPSVDVLFRSAAVAYGGDIIAVILTGMGVDGAGGVKSVKKAGGYVIAQDRETSVVWGMPGSAKATGMVDQVLPLKQIPDAIQAVMQKSGSE